MLFTLYPQCATISVVMCKPTRARRNRAFTLIEALIVVLIVGLLAGLAIAKLGNTKIEVTNALLSSWTQEVNSGIGRLAIKDYTNAGDALTTDANGVKGVLTILVNQGLVTRVSGDKGMTFIDNNTTRLTLSSPVASGAKIPENLEVKLLP